MAKDKKFIRVEYDLNYWGGDYSKVGQFVLISDSLIEKIHKKTKDHDEALKQAFKKHSGHDPAHIINYNFDELYDAEGDLIEGGFQTDGQRGEFDTQQEVCPKCKSDNIANEGPPDDGQLEITCHDCMYQWIEPSDDKDEGFDLHVWAKPGGLYTLSIGKCAVAVDVNKEAAVDAFRGLLEG